MIKSFKHIPKPCQPDPESQRISKRAYLNTEIDRSAANGRKAIYNEKLVDIRSECKCRQTESIVVAAGRLLGAKEFKVSIQLIMKGKMLTKTENPGRRD